VLKLDFNVAIPGDVPAVSKADVEQLKTRIDAPIARAGQLIKSGVGKDQLMSLLKTDDLAWKPNFSPQQLDGFYAELSATK
jgi:hypothetical protein